MTWRGPTAVYRLYGRDDALLYVGIANRIDRSKYRLRREARERSDGNP